MRWHPRQNGSVLKRLTISNNNIVGFSMQDVDVESDVNSGKVVGCIERGVGREFTAA